MGERKARQEIRMDRISLTVKPHHLLDIFKLYGKGVEAFAPDEKYRHDFYAVGNRVIENRIGKVRFTWGCDDICKPCVCLKQNICSDTFLYGGTEYDKNSYNEALDRRLIDRLGLDVETEYEYTGIVDLICEKLDPELIEFVWQDRSREENKARYEDTRRGIEKHLSVLNRVHQKI